MLGRMGKPFEGTFVGSAIRDARVEPDDRGLMPLAEARRLVEAAKVYRKGEGETKGGTFVLESDVLMAALLSLADTAEFVKHAKRIDWQFHVRGRDNVAPFERYGSGIVEWLATRISKDGVFVNVPWCCAPCLFAIPTKEALQVALRARAMHELLPGQPKDGTGPGAFAADRDHSGPVTISLKEAQKMSGSKDELAVARRWIDANPSAYPMLAELAQSGDARAKALLVDRTKKLGGFVREAVGDVLADALDLPKSHLPPAVRAIVEEGTPIDEPPGPPWNVTVIDELLESLSMWDASSSTTGAVRVRGFASRHGDAIVVERVFTWPQASELVAWSAFVMGPGRPGDRLRYAEELVDPKADKLEELEIPGGRVDGITGVLEYVDAGNHSTLAARPVFPEPHFLVALKRPLSGEREDVSVDYHLPRSFQAAKKEWGHEELRCISPVEGLLLQLCRRHPEKIFAEEAALRQKLLRDPEAKLVFDFRELAWPAWDVKAADHEDFVAMVEAIRRRRAITRLPLKPDGYAELRWPPLAEERSYYGDDPWHREDPIEPAGYVERYFPHGAKILHAPEWNAPGMAEQTVPYLLAQTASAMQVTWPRRVAQTFARAVGGSGSASARRDVETLITRPEARAIVESFVHHASSYPAHFGADLVDVLEGLVSGVTTIDAFLKALKTSEGKGAALGAAAFELGFVLNRMRPKTRAKWRARLAALEAKNDVARALALVLGDRAAAEAHAKEELDYAFVTDREWAASQLLEAAPSRASAWLMRLGGPRFVEKVKTRLANASEGEAAFLKMQLDHLRNR
jgi:hypothetical protein